MEAFRERGDLTGTATISVPAGGSLTNTISQWVPTAAGQMRGYVCIRSNGAIAAVQLSADAAGEFLAAVPDQR